MLSVGKLSWLITSRLLSTQICTLQKSFVLHCKGQSQSSKNGTHPIYHHTGCSSIWLMTLRTPALLCCFIPMHTRSGLRSK